MRCSCGIPNKANWYVHVVLGRDVPSGTETSYSDIYACDEHMTDDTRSLFRFDNQEQWEILETDTHHLRE